VNLGQGPHQQPLEHVFLQTSVFFLIGGTRVWTQVFTFTTWAIPPVHFALVILEMESHELFAWAVLGQWASQSQSPK
jgi:hypothetical protein